MVGKLARQSLENFDQVLNLTLITEQKFFNVVGLTQVLELESTVLSLFFCVLTWKDLGQVADDVSGITVDQLYWMHNDVLALSVDLGPESLAWGVGEITRVPILNHGYNTCVVSLQKRGVAACLHDLVKLNTTKAKRFEVGREDLKRVQEAVLGCQISFCLGTLAETTKWIHNLL